MIKGSVVLALAFCVAGLLRRRSAAERHVLWAAAIGAAAVLPLFSLLLPSWHADVVGRVMMAALPALSGPSAFQTARSGADVVMHADAIEPAGLRLAQVLWIIWLSGAVVAVLTLVAGAVRLARTLRAARPIVDPGWNEAAADVSRGLGRSSGRPICFLQAPGDSMPATWGIWRPRVLLPSCAAEWSDDRKRAVLAHELAHVSRHDWAVQILAEVVCAIYWFNPLFWLAYRRLRRETEQACDDAVITLGVDGRDYAVHLLEIARALKASGRVWSPALAMARRTDLEARFVALLSAKASRRAVTRTAACTVAVATLLLVLPLAAMRPSAAGTVIPDVAAVKTAGAPTLPRGLLREPEPKAVTAIRGVRAGGRPAPPDGVVLLPDVVEYTTPPLYSDEARRLGIEGTVTVEVRVDGNGGVEIQRIVKSLGFGLDQNALVALRQWRFSPGTRNGRPEPMSAEIDIEFSLRNEALNELIANDMATRIGPDVSPPRVVRRVDVPLPSRAGSGGRQGAVILDVVVLEDGTPKIVRIIRSLDSKRDESAVRAIEQWRFSPAMKDGRAVKVRMNAEVRFDAAS